MSIIQCNYRPVQLRSSSCRLSLYLIKLASLSIMRFQLNCTLESLSLIKTQLLQSVEKRSSRRGSAIFRLVKRKLHRLSGLMNSKNLISASTDCLPNSLFEMLIDVHDCLNLMPQTYSEFKMRAKSSSLRLFWSRVKSIKERSFFFSFSISLLRASARPEPSSYRQTSSFWLMILACSGKATSQACSYGLKKLLGSSSFSSTILTFFFLPSGDFALKVGLPVNPENPEYQLLLKWPVGFSLVLDTILLVSFQMSGKWSGYSCLSTC